VGQEWRSVCNHPGHLVRASRYQAYALDDTPEILHAFGERAGGFRTGIVEYPPMAVEPHVIDTFDEAADPDAAKLVASIERTIASQ
jgi:hypothetical protein